MPKTASGHNVDFDKTEGVSGFSRYIEGVFYLDVNTPLMSPAYEESNQAMVHTDMDWETLAKYLSLVFDEWEEQLVRIDGKLHMGSALMLREENMPWLEWKYTDTSRMKSGQNHMAKQAVVDFTNKWLRYYLIMEGKPLHMGSSLESHVGYKGLGSGDRFGT